MSDVNFTSHVNDVISELNAKTKIALEKVGIRAEKYAKALAPVGTPESTGIPGYIGGSLRDDINHKVIEDRVYIGNNIEYAPYQELGTRYMQAANKGKGYLRPAVEDHAKEYSNIIKDVMK